VSATMRLAYLAGIQVFATGGIGGVHRGAEQTGDISLDLKELGETPVIVISAGAKAILDLPRTLEYLETAGVPVLGYQTDEFPAFYSRKSGLSVAWRVDSPEEIAAIFREQLTLSLTVGLLVTNPVPLQFEIPATELNPIIEKALYECEQLGIRGKAVTPYLLGKIVELTAGRSLATNIQLALNNIRLGAAVALALTR
ncbi:MAG: pseudouridine-5-phosphate glycosidase, partial [Candidatus Marinimicrobia bacterium CG_4_10_14_0_2_um_filter_48_9]